MWAYNALVAALARPTQRRSVDLRERLEWLGEGFDPADFDRAATNAVLARVKL